MATVQAQLAALQQEVAYLKGNQTANAEEIGGAVSARDLDVGWLVLCGKSIDEFCQIKELPSNLRLGPCTCVCACVREAALGCRQGLR